MLAKKFKLPIQDFFKPGQPWKKFFIRKSGFFIIKIMDNDLPYSRFGVLVGKKIAKTAVKRNKIKRIVFDFIRLSNLHLNPGKDFLITILFAVVDLAKEEIENELAELFGSQKR